MTTPFYASIHFDLRTLRKTIGCDY